MSEITSVQWAKGSRFKVDAAKARECLHVIKKKLGGHITPEAIVEEAADDNSPIHSEFEWDDSVAAHEHRKETARAMTRSIQVIRKEAPNVVAREFEIQIVSSNEAEKKGTPMRCYRTTEDLLKDPVERDRLISRAIKELAAFRNRYAGLSELAVVFSAIDDVAAA